MRTIGRGRCAEIVTYEPNKVLKLFYPNFPEDGIQEEYGISQLAYSMGIPTPKSYEVIDYDNRRGIVYDQITGNTLLHMMKQKPWFIHKYSRILAKVHYQIHSHHLSDAIRIQKKVLCDNVRAAPYLTEEEKQRIIVYADQLPVGDRLCHADFHPDNVMTSDDNYIIDWMTGMSGHPAGDVARTLILLEFGSIPEGTPRLASMVIQFLRTRMKSEYLKQYIQISGLTIAEIDQWILPVAAARLVEWVPEEEKEPLLKLIRKRLQFIF